MSARGAAPGAVGDGPGSGLSSRGGGASIATYGLPDRIVERLEQHGVFTLADWGRLGRRRHQLFGITRAVVRQLDKLAKGDAAVSGRKL